MPPSSCSPTPKPPQSKKATSRDPLSTRNPLPTPPFKDVRGGILSGLISFLPQLTEDTDTLERTDLSKTAGFLQCSARSAASCRRSCNPAAPTCCDSRKQRVSAPNPHLERLSAVLGLSPLSLSVQGRQDKGFKEQMCTIVTTSTPGHPLQKSPRISSAKSLFPWVPRDITSF